MSGIILANAFSSHKDVTSFGTTVRQWSDKGYASYASVDFGITTKGIKVNYAKVYYGGEMEIRLGGPTGPIIAEFTTAHTGSPNRYITAYIGLLDGVSVTGVHPLTFVCKESLWSFSLAYFELSDFADRTAVQTLIKGSEISSNFGVQITLELTVGWFENDDFVTYSQVNFGAPGATKGILLRYSKDGYEGNSIEVRLGGPTGQLLGEFVPIDTSSWSNYVDAYVELNAEGVDGIHDLTFVGKGSGSVLNLESFSIRLASSSNFPSSVSWHSYSAGTGLYHICYIEVITHFCMAITPLKKLLTLYISFISPLVSQSSSVHSD